MIFSTQTELTVHKNKKNALAYVGIHPVHPEHQRIMTGCSGEHPHYYVAIIIDSPLFGIVGTSRYSGAKTQTTLMRYKKTKKHKKKTKR